MMRSRFAIALVSTCMVASAALAQEVCFKDAKDNFAKWQETSGAKLSELSDKYVASKDPHKEMIDYAGMRMPIAAALIIEGEKYGRAADTKLVQEIEKAKTCSGQVTVPRGVYDLAREWLGLTTILPERATRIDFAELKKGNLPGGKHSVIRTTGRKIDETINPFRW